MHFYLWGIPSMQHEYMRHRHRVLRGVLSLNISDIDVKFSYPHDIKFHSALAFKSGTFSLILFTVFGVIFLHFLLKVMLSFVF